MDPQQPDTVIVTPFLRVCFAVIMRMFMDHQQFLVYIKDSPKHPASCPLSDEHSALPVSLCPFPSTQKHLYPPQFNPQSLGLGMGSVWRRETKISFWKSHARLKMWAGFQGLHVFSDGNRTQDVSNSLAACLNFDFTMQGGVKSIYNYCIM